MPAISQMSSGSWSLVWQPWTAVSNSTSFSVDTCVYVYTMAFTGVLKQQQDSFGFICPIANRGCSRCLVTRKQIADLTSNFVLNTRCQRRPLCQQGSEGFRNSQKPKSTLLFFSTSSLRKNTSKTQRGYKSRKLL